MALLEVQFEQKFLIFQVSLQFWVDLPVQTNSILAIGILEPGVVLLGLGDILADLVDSYQILLAMGPALQLILVLNILLHHFLADDLPGFAVNGEEDDEFLVECPVPEVLAIAQLTHVARGMALVLDAVELLLLLFQAGVSFEFGLVASHLIFHRVVVAWHLRIVGEIGD